jgi:hypothetical protein
VPKLVVFRGEEVETEVRLRGGTVRIGRDARNEIVLDDPTQGVSRFHAEVRSEGGRYVVADLKSRNGVWMGGQRIKGRAELSLGVPVTIGSFELVLEDDVSSGIFEEDARAGGPRTAAVAPIRTERTGRAEAIAKPARPGGSGPASRSFVWVAAAVGVVAVGGIAWVVVRNVTAPVPGVSTLQQTSTAPAPAPATTSAPLPPPEDPNKVRLEEALAAARQQMQTGDYTGALASLDTVLAIDSGHADALDLKRQALDATRPAAPPKPKPDPVDEADGIPRKAGESAAEYRVRAQRIQSEWSSGRASLAKEDYAGAIQHFRAVEQDEPRYPGLEAALTDTGAQQQKVFNEAMGHAQAHETRGNLHDARGWYERAAAVDPNSAAARDKATAVRSKLFDQARKLLEQGSYAMKSDDQELATSKFRQIMDMLRPGDELRDEAARRLEELKR